MSTRTLSRGQGNGAGWGGPARGASTARTLTRPPLFQPGNQAARGPHDMERHRRLKALEARLYEIAMGTTGVTGNVCIRAAEALLNRIEGKPKAMSFDLPVDDFCMFSDDELVAELDRLRVPVL